MDKNKLLPSLNIAHHLDKSNGDIHPAKYMTGFPRSYRFDAGKGILNFNGEDALTKPGKEFKILPVALRIFKGNLFERGRNTWCEIFFLNQANQLGVVLFHGYSVENLERLQSELFYEDLMINEVVLTVKPSEKTSKTSGSGYYIAEFEFEPANKELLSVQNIAVEGFSIYRHDTWGDDQDMIVNLNYHELPKLNAPDETDELFPEIGMPTAAANHS